MKVFAATTLVFSLLFSGAVLSLPSVSEARELPPRAISADAECHVGQVNGHDGFICRDGNIDYFCTEPRTDPPAGPLSFSSRQLEPGIGSAAPRADARFTIDFARVFEI